MNAALFLLLMRGGEAEVVVPRATVRAGHVTGTIRRIENTHGVSKREQVNGIERRKEIQ